MQNLKTMKLCLKFCIKKHVTKVALFSQGENLIKMTKFLNKKSCFIDKNVKLGKNVTIYENNHIEGNSVIGDNCVLLPGNYIISSQIGNDCCLHASVIEESIVKEGGKIGPFAHIRPQSEIGKNCKIGNFVEIKKSIIGDGTKISHLTYVGDAQIGRNCNLGCGVVFANYDGKKKHKTIVGDRVFIGCNSNLVAPVKIESESFIACGSTITDDVSKGDLAIARARQTNLPARANKYILGE